MSLDARLPRFIRDFFESALTLTEGVTIIIASLWPVLLTLRLVLGFGVGWEGFDHFLIGSALLAIAAVIRRDRKRFLLLVGPLLLLIYSTFLACLAFLLLMKGKVDASILPVVALAIAVAVLTMRWHIRNHERSDEDRGDKLAQASSRVES